MRRLDPQSIAALAAVATLAVVAIVAAPNPRPTDEAYVSTGYRADGYRAWAALLEREGIATERFRLRPIELDGRIDTLVSAQPSATVGAADSRTAADVGALAAWVRRGGRLVYLGQNPNVADAETRALELPLVMPEVGARGALAGPLARTAAALFALGRSRMLFVEQPGRVELADGNGDVVVRYPLGRGEVVAVVDPALFSNAHIGAAGNARLAFRLGSPRRAGGRVAFDDGVHGALIDRPWYAALPVPVLVSLAVGGVALVLGVVGSALPGCPPMSVRVPREPGSDEFIAALAALYERIGARATVAAILGRGALAAVARRLGLPGDTPPAVIVARTASRPGFGDVSGLACMLDTPPVTDDGLLASARLAYLVRKECIHGSNRDRGRAAFAGRAGAGRRR